MSNDGVDAGLSVARQTGTPASRNAATGAVPQPRMPFERGQCATTTPWLGQQPDLLVVHGDAVGGEQPAGQAARVSELADPRPARRRRQDLSQRLPAAGAGLHPQRLVDALREVGA